MGLSKIFDVSEVTIRQDLDKLAGEGLVVREHGGAFLRDAPDLVRTLSLQHTENMDRKTAIGKKAAEFVRDGEIIILDSGTTTTEMARNLGQRRDLTVITNGLNIALILGAEHGVETLVTGGEFKPPTLSVTGDKAAAFFENVHVDKLFLATAGMSPESGLTYPGFSDLPVKMAMIRAASTVYLVADSTKTGKQSLATLGDIDLVDCLITDNGMDSQTRKQFADKGVQVIVAQEDAV